MTEVNDVKDSEEEQKEMKTEVEEKIRDQGGIIFKLFKLENDVKHFYD